MSDIDAETSNSPDSSRSTQTMLRTLEENSRRQKKIERIVIASSLAFVVSIAVAAWLTDGKILQGPITLLQRVEANRYGNKQRWNPAANCMNPENRNTPYCVERKAQREGDWRDIVRSGSGTKQAFRLTDR